MRMSASQRYDLKGVREEIDNNGGGNKAVSVKTILAILGVVFGVILATWIYARVVFFFSLMGQMFAAVGMLAIIVLLAYLLLANKFPRLAMKKSKQSVNYKVREPSGKSVYLFREAPELADVALMSDELHVAQLELRGDVFQVQSDTNVIVLDDSRAEAVLVKIPASGVSKKKQKTLDSEGWVPRSSLVKDTRQLPAKQ